MLHFEKSITKHLQANDLTRFEHYAIINGFSQTVTPRLIIQTAVSDNQANTEI